MSNNQATAEWSDEFPTTEGAFYWVRHKLNHEDLDVGSLLNGSLYFTYGGPTSKSRCKDYEYLGPITPEQFAEAGRLREALEQAHTTFEQYKERHMVPAYFYAALADLRKALKGETDGIRTNSASQ